jgi:hypothetical protein
MRGYSIKDYEEAGLEAGDEDYGDDRGAEEEEE